MLVRHTHCSIREVRKYILIVYHHLFHDTLISVTYTYIHAMLFLQVSTHLNLNLLLLNHFHLAHFQREVLIFRPVCYYWIKSGSHPGIFREQQSVIPWFISALRSQSMVAGQMSHVISDFFSWHMQYGDFNLKWWASLNKCYTFISKLKK